MCLPGYFIPVEEEYEEHDHGEDDEEDEEDDEDALAQQFGLPRVRRPALTNIWSQHWLHCSLLPASGA